ncbi:GTP-binding protein [Paenibacillus albidus]|uniref:CobW family GTP-binding protein n=1 Tax=Paenibacillus albidus TaxID=2041023 RepID=UPI001BE608FC|nr:CobW family GTP-binding protein [Paenibacillus albidus]MBT2289398.1 GTP-binding protein [Paenibacillus albidus]
MRIPVIILSGFLGSGKTTLLLSILKESTERGLHPGVVMNELGKRDVDGYILQEHTGARVEKLLDGCVCCSRKEELAGALIQLLKRSPDAIYIELTGVANPEEIIRTLEASPLREQVMLHSAITVLDAENALEYNSRFSADKQLVRTLHKQLAAAHLIVVNKSDLVEPDTLWRIEKIVRKHNNEAELVFTHYSEINLTPLLAGILPRNRSVASPQRAYQTFKSGALRKTSHEEGAVAVKEPQEEPAASYSQVTAITLTFPPGKGWRLTKEQLEHFFAEWDGSLLRAKGHVLLPEEGSVQLVQYAGLRTLWEDSRYPGQPYVVFIGMNLNEALLTERWSALFT